MDLYTAIKNRRSVRQYTEETLPEGALDTIVKAGLLSATGHGKRPWELVVVTDHGKLEELSTCRIPGKMLAGAQAAIVVLGDEELSDTWIEDCAIVMTNMHLMADYLGVGSCWIQVRNRMRSEAESTEAYVRQCLHIPENRKVAAILSLGMPANHPAPNEWDELGKDKIHYECY